MSDDESQMSMQRKTDLLAYLDLRCRKKTWCVTILNRSIAVDDVHDHSTSPVDAYKRFARWTARTVNLFAQYFTVLDAGLQLETKDFGELTEDEYVTF